MASVEELVGEDIVELEKGDERKVKGLKQIKAAAVALYKSATTDRKHPQAANAWRNIEPLHVAAKHIEKELKILEKDIIAKTRLLPVAAWVKNEVKGVGMLSLASIVGEAGDLANYERIPQLWKRMGLAVIDGERQRKCADAEKAIAHGYVPQRRAVMWVIGDCIIKTGATTGDGLLLRKLYDERKAKEANRFDAKGELVRPIVAHLRAKRYVEKYFLHKLWQQWTRMPEKKSPAMKARG